jgi:hypothetical protein
MKVGHSCLSFSCSSWRLFLALVFPSALVSVWHATFSLTELALYDARPALNNFTSSNAPRGNTQGDTTRLHNNASSSVVASRVGVPARSPYAYVFLMGFCDPDRPTYKPYIASISVAAYLLRKYGSKQDIFLYVMMLETSTHKTLPADDVRIFDSLNVTVRQIPSVRNQTFHRLQLQKFRALGLTQYKRVMFLDCDVMPLLHVDFLFEYSDPDFHNPPILKENLIFVDYIVPSNGGIWMLTPHEGDLEQVNGLIREAQIVRNQGIEGREPWRLFKPQPWESLKKKSDEYNFFAVSGDQGLLFSWVRHYKRTYSHVVRGGAVVNYVPDESDDQAVIVESTIEDPFIPHWSIWPADEEAWGTDRSRLVGTHADFGHGGIFKCFHHFINFRGKPWYDEGCVHTFRWSKEQAPVSEGVEIDERAFRFWCQTFVELDALYNSTVQLDDLHSVPWLGDQHDAVNRQQWATEGPITNLLDPDFDPRDLRKH